MADLIIENTVRALPFNVTTTYEKLFTTDSAVTYTVNETDAKDGNKIILPVVQNHPIAFPGNFIKYDNSPEHELGKLNIYTIVRVQGKYYYKIDKSAADIDVPGLFTFTLMEDARVSAGVYNADDVLVRTLFSGVQFTAGSHAYQWDGLLDDYTTSAFVNADGSITYDKTFNVKVLTNNVKYTWEGVIGNTSTSLTDNVFKSYGGNTCFAFVGTKGFYGQFFYEGGTNSKYFNLNDIGRTYDINVGVHAITIDCATDGNIVVWACADQYQNNGQYETNLDGSFVLDAYGNKKPLQTNYLFATNVSDNTPVSFTSESSHYSGREGELYSHFIGWFADKNTISYTGVAINSNFVFATIQAKNQLIIYDRTSGNSQTVTYSSPTKLVAGANNELWMIVNNVLKKFTVDATTGELADANLSINATNPACVRISPDNFTVLITDAGTHQVKAYANSTGALQWVLGQEGGYDTNGPAVTVDKFMFSRVDFASPAIAYQPDGSFWVNDMGNYRTLHFNADRTYKEQIMYMPASRSTNADPNNPTRIFGDELEFQRDYSKPLDNGANGSWKLINNWKVGTSLDIFAKFLFVITLSNGHTYGGSGARVYDLTPTGAVDVCAYPVEGHMEADGSFWTRLNYGNDYFEVRKLPFAGFTTLPSGVQVPIWGSQQVVVTTPTITAMMPLWYLDNTIGAITNPNRYFFFNPNSASLGFGATDFNYHLGSIKTGSNTFEWEASKSTFQEYRGDYPRNGDFDTSNEAGHSENCRALVNGSNVFWNVNGEFWRANSIGGGEINIWNHFNENGLFIGNFGKTGIDAALTGNTQFAGNAFSTALVRVGDDFYIYHCDENQHGGVHSWNITGLDTISEHIIPIAVDRAIVPLVDETDLMAGLPYRSYNFSGGNGWTILYPSNLLLRTNKLQYQKENIDIALGKDASDGNGNALILKSLNNTSALTNWQLSAGISYQDSELTFGDAPDGSDNFNYLEIIDQAGKILTRFIGNMAYTRDGSYYPRIWLNNTIVAEGSAFKGTGLYLYRNISFVYNAGTLVFKYQEYPAVNISTPFETGGDLSAPAFLRVIQGGNRTRFINLYKLKFFGK